MKVVLFCGGLGMRLREYSESVPKPMVNIGYRPLLWHVMKYYAHFGHKDFILCLGYKADVIKNYFRHYDECQSNDFVLSAGGRDIRLLNSDIDDWRITFVDTGVSSSVGERLKAVEPYLRNEDIFLANYTDGLSDLNLSLYVDHMIAHRRIGNFLSVRPTQTFHVVSVQESGVVTDITPVEEADIWINAGFFVFRSEIFSYLGEGEDLVCQPFKRLIQAGELMAHQYRGFWTAMDTFKDKERLDNMYAKGKAPWEVWKNGKAAAEIIRPHVQSLPQIATA
jgi:glucose-1-phosphate cytidylyltransferase